MRSRVIFFPITLNDDNRGIVGSILNVVLAPNVTLLAVMLFIGVTEAFFPFRFAAFHSFNKQVTRERRRNTTFSCKELSILGSTKDLRFKYKENNS